MTKYQIYSHYKLPITKDPLKFGKLLDQTNNKFIMQLTTKNVAVINHYEKENFVRIFKNGDLVLEFRDKFINETSLIKYLENCSIFKHKKAELFILFELFLIFLVFIIFFVIFPDVNEDSPTISLAAYNVFKMRKVASKYN